MTPEKHNKYLAYSHLAYGVFYLLLMVVVLGFIWVILSLEPDPPPFIFILFFSLFILGINGVIALPSFVAGYGLLKRKPWAKTWAIVSGVLAAMQFPVGTAVCIYTFCLLFSNKGRQLFEGNNYALPPGRQPWAYESWNYEAQRQREGQFTPPPSPPDWR